MAKEYIEREAAIKDLECCRKEYSAIGNVDGACAMIIAKNVISKQPTADVVPKSEVEKWKEINEQLYKEMSERILEERKIERKYVARKIFEEIESKLTLNKATHCGQKFYYIRLEDDIAELKKKYTEGQNNQ